MFTPFDYPFRWFRPMPRQPTLRKKKVGNSVYWFTKTGGDTYFGSVEEVPYKEARKLFADHVQSLQDEKKDSKGRGFTSGDLMDLFLDWIKKHRSDQTYTTRRIYCSRFGDFVVGGNRIADLPANRTKGADLEAFLEQMKADKFDAQTRLHAETSIRHCWNWATKHPSPTPYLSPIYRPFSAVERTRVPHKALTEADLLTQAEVESILFCAEIELDQFRRFGMEETIKRMGVEKLRQSARFSELLRCYYHTGARTEELARCEVGDLLLKTRQVVLGRHKRSRTLRTPVVRHITLNNEALAIFQKNCKGKAREDRVFLNDDDCPWTVRNLGKRFERAKELGEALERPIRQEASIYDFRHLWISDALMAGNDIATVARMAGTSIGMIERVYGHFRNEHLQKAQKRLDHARKQRQV